MRTARSVKGPAVRGKLVAVIASPADLHRATKLRHLPDLFELRLDALESQSSEIKLATKKLKLPLIITARHPAEGGCSNLSSAQRHRLLCRFLSQAAFVDIELRSCAQLKAVLAAARDRNIKKILSVHALRQTPSSLQLERFAKRAQKLAADIFKIVMRTDTVVELARLLDFFEDHKKHMRISAMGVGRLGKASRIALMQNGSVLNYAHLTARGVEGQLSLMDARRLSASRSS